VLAVREAWGRGPELRGGGGDCGAPELGVRREAPEVATRALAVVTWRERRRAPEVLAVAAAARRRLLRDGRGASLAGLLVRPVRKPLGYDLVMAALAALVQDSAG
jgi:hypothetical protein